MNKSFEFYFDFGSLASYLAWTQLPALSAQTGATVLLRPMLLGGVFQATGNRSPVSVPLKGAYMMADMRRFAQRYGVPLVINPFFPINTLMLMRVAVGLQMRNDSRFHDYCDAVFKAIWVDALDMGDPSTVGAALTKAGFDPQDLLALSAEQAVKDQLKSATQHAVERGIFGAPTFFVGPDMFWGQDRLDFVRDALEAMAHD